MAAPTYDNSVKVSSAANVASLTSASWAVANTSNQGYLAALVGSGAGTPVAPNACKWQGSGGTSLTQQGTTQNQGANGKASCFGLKNPTAASSTLYCSWASNQDETALIGISANGVDQTTPTGTLATGNGTNTSMTASASTSVDDLVIGFGWWLNTNCGAETVNVTSGTSRQEIEGATLNCEGAFGATNTAVGASTTIAGTISGAISGGWTVFALPLKPVIGAATNWGPLIGMMNNRLVNG